MLTDEEQAADHALVRGLLGLHNAHDKQSDNDARGRLANLRYGLRDRLHADYPVGRVFPALTPGALTDNEERNEWRTLIAALFGYAHDDVEDAPGVSLGTALRSLYDKRKNDSLERRFMALLNADAEHLPGHLRQAVSLLKSEGEGLDWGRLLKDVCSWDAPQKPVHKRWTRDYYRARTPQEDESAEKVADTDLDAEAQ